MTKEHLELLDFILPKLSEMYPDGNTLNSLAHEYKKITKKEHGYQDLRLLKDSYDGQYFTVYKDSDYIRITHETKEIIDNDGSLSKYFENQNKLILEEQKEQNKLNKLQIENLEFKKTIRDQEQRIRDLDEQNKFIQVIKGYWWLFLICLGLGIYIGKLIGFG